MKSSTKQYKSDVQELVRLHLQDKNHVFTEEELKSIKVGTMPEQPSMQTEQYENEGKEKQADKGHM